ncbi:MAG: agmatine deiminase family protein [Acidobacteria bacterium]|nr:agmatine deiminase family protein [Acidobacteriota bacterium]
MKTLRLAGLWLALLAFSGPAVPAGEPAPQPAADKPELPIGLTEEEKTRLHEIGAEHRNSAPPAGPVRNPAEWEPSEGVLVRWPLGISVDLVAEMSEDVVVTTIVANASEEQAARNAYTNGGVRMDHVAFVYAATDSIWVRDYGPWFIFDDGKLGIVDHIYNRPRPRDDVVPQAIGAAWGLPVFGMDLIHTGGNHMSDGLGTSASSDLVYDENPGKTPAEIARIMRDYLGNEYFVLQDIQSGGIHHIDCWAKFLGPSTVMVKDVPVSDPTWDDLNARAADFASRISPWGVPYTVVRVFCPAGTFYTNSLILNKKALVPTFGNSQDSIALATYAAAMPGYEVLGFPGSWATEDALHCRTMGVPDRGMLVIGHVPYRQEDITWGDYRIEASIEALSGAPLVPGELAVRYSAAGGPWQTTPLQPGAAPHQFVATVPAQPEGAEVAYFIQAADASGRRESHPYIGAPWAHSFTAICPNHPLVDVLPEGPLPVCEGSGQLLTAALTGGTGPFTFQWLRDGQEIPGANESSYLALDSGTHEYSCRVWGAGCVNPRVDPVPVVLTWQSAPVFSGLAAVANPQAETCALDLAWEAGIPACGGPLRYTVYRSTTSGFTPGPDTLLVTGIEGLSFRDSSPLEFARTYHYAVRARDLANGVEETNTVERPGTPSGPGGGSETLFEDAFENPADWALWQVSTGPGPHTCGNWARVDSDAQRPPGSAGFYALTDSQACGAGSKTSTILFSPTIDADVPGITALTLEYDTYYRYRDGDKTTVAVRDGAAWQTVWTAPASSVQDHHTIDVTPWGAGNPSFRLRFSYQNAAYDYWFAVDNVRVTAQVQQACSPGAATVSTVPDGTEPGTEPLRAVRTPEGIQLSWDTGTAACTSAGYHLVWGWGRDLAAYAVSGADCTLSPGGSHLWTASPDAVADMVWFLVLGNDGGAIEGGWGTAFPPAERSLVPSGQCGRTALSLADCVP